MNTFISPHLKRTKDVLDKNGNVIQRIEDGKQVQAPLQEKE